MAESSARSVRVWDLPTRIFHWCLASAAVGMLVTGKIGDEVIVWHARLGYFVGALVLFRIIWGFVGGHWSRFAAFPPIPSRAWRHLREGEGAALPGHNPLGAWSVYAMLLFFLLQFASGLFTETKEDFTGPLTSLVSNGAVHILTGYHKRVGQWILIALVVLHLTAILYYLWYRKRNLVRAMVGGDTLVEHAADSARDDTASRLLALVLFAACAVFVWWLVKLGS